MIQRRIGFRQECVSIHSVACSRGNSNAYSDRSRYPWFALNRCPQPFAKFRRASLMGIGQDDGELFATVASRHVNIADPARQDGGDLLQHLVSFRVAKGVIILFEVIHIDHNQT